MTDHGAEIPETALLPDHVDETVGHRTCAGQLSHRLSQQFGRVGQKE